MLSPDSQSRTAPGLSGGTPGMQHAMVSVN